MKIPIEEITTIYMDAYRKSLNENNTQSESEFYAMKQVNLYIEELNKLEKTLNDRQ